MKSFYSNHKISFAGLLLVLFLVFSGFASAQENIANQTSEMIKTLEEIRRTDTELPGYPVLLNQIFSSKKNLRKAEHGLTVFFATEGNFAGKRWLLNRMLQTGSEEATEYMAGLLHEPNAAHLALMALQEVPGKTTGEFIKKQFTGATPVIQVGILQTLGEWRDAESVNFISKQTKNENPDVTNAAFLALGKIGTEESAAVLTKAVPIVRDENKTALMEALLVNAGYLAAENQPEKAFELYAELAEMNPPVAFAVAAVKGQMKTTPGNQAELLKENLKTASEKLKPELINLVAMMPASFSGGDELLQVPGLTEAEKLQLVLQLGRRGDKSIRDEALRFAEHENKEYHVPALRALAGVARTAEVPFLIKLAATGRGEEQVLARRILYTLPGNDVDEYLVNQLSGADEELAIEYLNAIGERNSADAAEALLQTVKNGSPAVRIEATKTLAKVAGAEETDEILQLLLAAESSRERKELERTLFLVATKNGSENAATEIIVEALKNAGDNENITSLLSVLGTIGNPEDVNVLKEYLSVEDTELQLAAIRALSEWPNAAPLEELKEVMNTAADERLKAMAVKGFTQLVLKESGFSEEKKVLELEYVLEQAANDREKQLVISALGKVPAIQSLQVLEEELKSPGKLRAELEAAVISILPELMEDHRTETVRQLQSIKEHTENEEILKWLKN